MSHYPRKLLTAVVLLVCVAAIVYFFWREPAPASAAQRGQAAVPVVVAQVVRTDVPHLLNTVGTVEPLHSVVVRPQIEGVLTQVLFEEGQDVTAGQPIATIDDRVLQAMLNSARAELASNASRLRSAEADLARYRNLVEHSAISRQVLDQQEALVEQLKADLLRNEASIEDALVRLSYTQILSPVSGRVGIRKVDAGNLVRPTDAEGIVTITQIHPISVLFSVAQNSLEPLRRTNREPEGAPVQAIDRSSGALLATGPISAIDNTVRVGSGTVQIRARFDNEDEILWPGQFVAVRVPVGRSRDAITVPSVAVRLGLDNAFVYRAGADGIAEQVPVQIVFRDEDNRRTVVQGDLSIGDKVVVDGFVRLRPGTKISVAEEIAIEPTSGNTPVGQSQADAASATNTTATPDATTSPALRVRGPGPVQQPSAASLADNKESAAQ